ncbi:MAG: spheroidene monooxygenase [Rubrivivax sp.]|jgi:spheroidene monooxygenase|nr:spheroidene monooxygenase [Rubrivivax sp.]
MNRIAVPPGEAAGGGRLQRAAGDGSTRGDAAPRPAGTGAAACGQVAFLLVAEMDRALTRAWAWSRLVVGARGLGRPAGMRFARVLGSGRDGGFGVQPSLSVYGLFVLFDDLSSAREFAARSPVVQEYRCHAATLAELLLRPYAARGSWGGEMVTAHGPPASADAPVAALTRASIRPTKAVAFWRHAPPSEVDLRAAAGCRMAVGLGEAPLLRQMTFSLWDRAASMDAYARSGAHLAAIRAAYGEGYFSETMFVRFEPLEVRGHWKGAPLG